MFDAYAEECSFILVTRKLFWTRKQEFIPIFIFYVELWVLLINYLKFDIEPSTTTIKPQIFYEISNLLSQDLSFHTMHGRCRYFLSSEIYNIFKKDIIFHRNTRTIVVLARRKGNLYVRILIQYRRWARNKESAVHPSNLLFSTWRYTARVWWGKRGVEAVLMFFH